MVGDGSRCGRVGRGCAADGGSAGDQGNADCPMCKALTDTFLQLDDAEQDREREGK